MRSFNIIEIGGPGGTRSPLATPKFHGVQQVAPRKFPCRMPLAFFTLDTGCVEDSSALTELCQRKKPYLADKAFFFGGPGGTRTLDTLLKRQVL